ncbi:MAG: dipeptidyl-peptidase 3 family protein, partial [Candidatus Angelobacter sp.]
MFGQQKNPQEQKPAVPDLTQIRAMTARFAPTQIVVNTSKLNAGDRQALVKLIEAARILNHVFMQQYWSGDLALYSKLQKDKSSLG